MTKHEPMPGPGPLPKPDAGFRILVVDDSRVQRMLMTASLRRHGFDVVEAESGEAALEICKTQKLSLILSDWVMPGMSGPELCRALKDDPDLSYVYFILLTSKSERAEIAQGLEQGADDFLTKPVNGDELRARLKAGIRVIEMQQQLCDKNRLVGQTLAELQQLYDMIEADLQEAKKLQDGLVRDRFQDFGTGQVSLLLNSSGHVGGDLVGCFRASPSQIGLYSIDVSGHGISSALMTARLAGHLNTENPRHNIALSNTVGEFYRVIPAHEVVGRFNDLMSSVIVSDLYFTLAFAVIDLDCGMVEFCQAGHPHPVIQRRDGTVEHLGNGGLPVGLIEGAEYERIRTRLNPGDRFILTSDGVTECPAPDGSQLEEEGFTRLLGHRRGDHGLEMLEGLVTDLTKFAGTDSFPDDISLAMFEFQGAQASSKRA